MKYFSNENEQHWEKTAELTNSIAASSPGESPNEATSHFANLRDLAFELKDMADMSDKTNRLLYSSPISLESLAMLEAELNNQGIASCYREATSACSVAQRATLDVNFLRWRARRFSFSLINMIFVVDVPRYVMSWAEELEKTLSIQSKSVEKRSITTVINRPSIYGKTVSNSREARQKLRYLNLLAAYLLGEFSRTSPKFNLGLDLILKVLTTPKPETPPADENKVNASENNLTICLPMTQDDFYKKLKAFKLDVSPTSLGCKP